LQRKLEKNRSPPPLRQQTGFLDFASTKKHAESASVDSKLRFLSTSDVHGLDFGFFGSGLRVLPTGSGVRFSLP